MSRRIPHERIYGLKPDTGIETAAVPDRRERFGPNRIIESHTNTWRELLKDTLADPMLWFLVVTSLMFTLTGQTREAIVLAIAVLPLAGMDLFLHQRTRASTATLGRKLASQATVVRDGKVHVIPSTDVVCGDLVLLRAGEAFPADGIIVHSEGAQVDESVLTGEAFPVHKQHCVLPERPDITAQSVMDADHWGFAGTRLLTGSLKLRVIFTGMETLYGEIVQSALQGRHEKTPLQIAIGRLVKNLLVAALFLCVVIGLVRLYQGFGWLDAIISSMTLAIAALPEEFPVVFTFFLGVGVYRLAKQGALVRRAVAVENIGRVSVICSDKTGTITEGKLTVAHIHPARGMTEQELLRDACWASRTDSGDPLDSAIIEAAKAHSSAARQLGLYPFTEDRKKETAIVQTADGSIRVVVKGAPEVILEQCSGEAGEIASWLYEAAQLAREGHKVIACAGKQVAGPVQPEEEPSTEFEFTGLLALEDPVRKGVAPSVDFCQRAGIHVLMITGDHPLTATAVAREIGLGNGHPRVITADEIEGRGADAEPVDLLQLDVIARSIPAQKMNIVKRLQATGEIVAVTGDGVNDVPALQSADVGVAMGERGTQATREVSAIVLLDDNFATIVRAVAEGAQLFHNIRLSFAYLILIHIPLVISATLIPLLGYPLLYLPIHIVYLELIIHPTAMLVYQQMRQHRTVPDNKQGRDLWFFTRRDWLLLYTNGLILAAILTGSYIFSLGPDQNVEHARTMAIAMLGLYSAVVTSILSRLQSLTAKVVVASTVVSMILLTNLPQLYPVLHLAPLHWMDWLIALIASILASLALVNRFSR